MLLSLVVVLLLLAVVCHVFRGVRRAELLLLIGIVVLLVLILRILVAGSGRHDIDVDVDVQVDVLTVVVAVVALVVVGEISFDVVVARVVLLMLVHSVRIKELDLMILDRVSIGTGVSAVAVVTAQEESAVHVGDGVVRRVAADEGGRGRGGVLLLDASG